SQAFVHAVEGAEDNAAMGRSDLMAIHLSGDDVLVGIAASGRTPYVLGAMAYAHTLDTPVICVTCSSGSEMSRMADISIEPIPGPEVITGSTRLKSGTAQKMVLNMLSTATMIKLGKVYGNLMVDVKATNEKLMERTVSIVRTATGANDTDARKALRACKNSAKSAIMMLMGGLDATQAQLLLEQCDGRITQALEQLHS
ncbi:MAG: N-acetylmuramic acid 6-phosphate etherase, partial [Angelakisella sp.]